MWSFLGRHTGGYVLELSVDVVVGIAGKNRDPFRDDSRAAGVWVHFHHRNGQLIIAVIMQNFAKKKGRFVSLKNLRNIRGNTPAFVVYTYSVTLAKCLETAPEKSVLD